MLHTSLVSSVFSMYHNTTKLRRPADCDLRATSSCLRHRTALSPAGCDLRATFRTFIIPSMRTAAELMFFNFTLLIFFLWFLALGGVVRSSNTGCSPASSCELLLVYT
jgi:hypothetical protein